jgi:23S rRNA (cytidine1920-2'-O)/16S rRNA (cytidine1409-2'-O)-methyltransferase
MEGDGETRSEELPEGLADPRAPWQELVEDAAEDLDEPADVIVADLSFISLRTVLPVVVPLGRTGADLVLLVKPQFEAGRQEAARGKGVITDPIVWRRVLEEVAGTLAEVGAAIIGAMASPLTGADGNVEFLLHARCGPGAAPVPAGPLLDAAVAEAGSVR